MIVQDFFAFLNARFPLADACDFDHVGLLVGDREAPVSKVLVSLDCTKQAISHAKAEGCELIITHHPVIFDPLSSVTAGSVVYEVVRHGISVLCFHTNLDQGDGGVNDQLCAALSLCEVEKLPCRDGFSARAGLLPSSMTGEELARFLRSRLNGAVKYVATPCPIRRVMVCSGSGGDYLDDAIAHHCDALITADVKHHQFVEAQNVGFALFDAGHFHTEDVVIEPLAALLREHFPEIEILTDHTSFIQSV